MLKTITETASYLLNNYSPASQAKEYLNNRLDTQTQETFEFGYFPDAEHFQSLTSIIGDKDLLDNKLVYYREFSDNYGYHKIPYLYFENYPLIMPFKDPYGNIIGIVGRSLLSDSEREEKKISKYKNTIFKKGNYLFGLYENAKHILQQDAIYIVEGQFDVIKAYQYGFRNVVALGSCAMTDYQFAMCKRYTDNIFLLLDGDEAGNKGRERIHKKYDSHADIIDARLPKQYKDLDEYLSANKCSFEEIDFRM